MRKKETERRKEDGVREVAAGVIVEVEGVVVG